MQRYYEAEIFPSLINNYYRQVVLTFEKTVELYKHQARRKRGGRAPNFLAYQLTLSQPGRAHYPHPVLCAPPDLQTLRRP